MIDSFGILISGLLGLYQLWIAYRIKTTGENVILFYEKIALELHVGNKVKQDEIRAELNSPNKAYSRMYFNLVFGVFFLACAVFWLISSLAV